MKHTRRMTHSELTEWHAYIKTHGGFGLSFEASTSRWATYLRMRKDQNRPIKYVDYRTELVKEIHNGVNS